MAYNTEEIEDVVVKYVIDQDNVSVHDAGIFWIPKTTLHSLKVIMTFPTSSYEDKTLTFVTIFNFNYIELCIWNVEDCPISKKGRMVKVSRMGSKHDFFVFFYHE